MELYLYSPIRLYGNGLNEVHRQLYFTIEAPYYIHCGIHYHSLLSYCIQKGTNFTLVFPFSSVSSLSLCVCVCVCARVRARARACVRACVRARACVCVTLNMLLEFSHLCSDISQVWHIIRICPTNLEMPLSPLTLSAFSKSDYKTEACHSIYCLPELKHINS